MDSDPIIIPDQCLHGPFHDLTTPIGLAYERLMAFSEITVPLEIDRYVDAMNNASKLDNKSGDDMLNKAKNRKMEMQRIHKQLYEELKKAKDEENVKKQGVYNTFL